MLLALSLLLVPAGVLAAQRPAGQVSDLQVKPARPEPAAGGQAVDLSSSYRAGARDVLLVTVFDEPELSGRFTIDSDGTLTFPLIGRVVVDGLTLRQIQEKLTELLAGGFLVNPQVSVEIAEYRSQNVYVLGEVRSPGVYTLAGNMSLIEVLVQAGSTSAAAGHEAQIVRAKAGRRVDGPVLPQENSDVEVTYVDLRDVQSGLLSQVFLRDGDTVYVPKAETFFVSGYVRSPNSYVWERGMTVLEAITLAGGFDERGSDRGIKIRRQVDGKEVEIDVGKDDPVQPRDMIIVRRRFF